MNEVRLPYVNVLQLVPYIPCPWNAVRGWSVLQALLGIKICLLLLVAESEPAHGDQDQFTQSAISRRTMTAVGQVLHIRTVSSKSAC